MGDLSVVGKRLPKIDALEKVRGAALFVDDLKFQGMLIGKILKSPHCHARILHIDTSRAKSLPGVKAVITADDTPKKGCSVLQEAEFQDKLPLADGKVRFMGDEVAAVAAVDEDTAAEALELIHVEYEILPAVFDPEKAMEAAAPRIHDAIPNNISAQYHYHFGDVERGFKDADVIVEGVYTTGRQAHACIEPHGCIVASDLDDRFRVWTSTQAPYWVRKGLSKTLDVSEGKIRIMEIQVAGALGGKAEMRNHEAICALLARRVRKPVKMILDREESLTTTTTRHVIKTVLKTGVKKDGTILARQAQVIVDNGAYNSCGPDVARGTSYALASLYRVANLKFDGYCIYTNNTYGGAMRGYGNPQVTFAIESQIDEIAEQISMDAMEFRLMNANRPGDVSACGWKMTSCGLPECIEKSADYAGWKEKRGKRDFKGIGMASLIHVSSARAYLDGDFSAASVKVHDDGSVSVSTGITDIGQGARTVVAQIVAEELGVAIDDVRVATMDTEVTPACMGTWGTRVTFVGGNAALRAAREAKQKLLNFAAEKLGIPVQNLFIKNGRICEKNKLIPYMTLAEATCAYTYRRGGGSVHGSGHYDCPSEFRNKVTGYGNVCAAYIFGTQVAEVEIDPDTGEVRVVRFTAAHDCGRAINPMAVEAQIEGGISQGMGFALLENLDYRQGRALNPDLLNYKIVTTLDVPVIKPIIVETMDAEGPFGAKGVGEPGMVPTAAAIANAIYDAVGVRIRELPITPDKILAAMRAQQVPSVGASPMRKGEICDER